MSFKDWFNTDKKIVNNKQEQANNYWIFGTLGITSVTLSAIVDYMRSAFNNSIPMSILEMLLFTLGIVLIFITIRIQNKVKNMYVAMSYAYGFVTTYYFALIISIAKVYTVWTMWVALLIFAVAVYLQAKMLEFIWNKTIVDNIGIQTQINILDKQIIINKTEFNKKSKRRKNK